MTEDDSESMHRQDPSPDQGSAAGGNRPNLDGRHSVEGTPISTDQDAEGVQPASDGETDARGGGKRTRETRKQKTRGPRPSDSDVTNTVFNYFAGATRVETAGVRSGDRTEPVSRRVTGRLDEADITATVSRYARPDCFVETVRLLRRQRVVVLEGLPGTGRRAGAVSLLREVTAGRLVVLSPLVTLRQLAEYQYKEGFGYLVVDRMPDRNSADIDFTWATVSDQVHDGKAYLVVTSAAVAARAANRAVPHVDWACPPASEVLRAQLIGRGYLREAVDETVCALVAELPNDCPLERLINLAELVGDGTQPTEALKQLDENAGREVRRWFAEQPSIWEIVEVTALCFLEGTDVRTFEMLLEALRNAIGAQLSAKQVKAARRDDRPFADRSARVDRDGLIGVKDVQLGAGTSRVMVFKDEAYLRFVLEQLWQTRSIAFWDAVRDWLDAIVVRGDSLRVASGLAWLACTSFDEVERSYLDPWSWGRIGWNGQVTAMYVLWYLCHREALAPVALQTTVGWANGRDIDRRWTALIAFAGDLGVSYPTDAANRIWQLTTQSDLLRGPGCNALACLFATLAEEAPEDATVVLRLLDRKMTKFGTGSGSMRMQANDLMRIRELTMTAALAVISIAAIRTRRSTIFEYLQDIRVRDNGDGLILAARIWAGVTCYRPFRREALIALRRGLHTLRDISDDPLVDARAFGTALSEAMPPHEREPFKRDFTTIDNQLRRGKKESPADVLLVCMEAISPRSDRARTPSHGGTQ